MKLSIILKKSILILFFFTNIHHWGFSNGMKNDSINSIFIGGMYGKNSIANDGGFYVGYRYSRLNEFFIGFSAAKYQGPGFLIGSRFFILPNSFISPYIALSYSDSKGSKFTLSELSDSPVFQTYYNKFSALEMGILKPLRANPPFKTYATISIGISYRHAFKINEARIVDGVYDFEKLYKINERLGSKFGFSIGINLYINTH